MSAVKEELLKITKIKAKKGESEQALMKRIIQKVDGFDEDKWSDLSEAAQLWFNECVEAAKSKKKNVKLPDFPADDDDDGDSDDDDSDEDEGDSDADDDDDDDDDDEDDSDDDDDDDSDEDDDDSDEDEDDSKSKKKASKTKAGKSDKKPTKSSKKSEDKKSSKKADKSDKKADKKSDKKPAKSSKAGGGRGQTTTTIKELIVKNPGISQEDLMAAMVEAGFETPSPMTVSTVRADMRQTLRYLQENGHLVEKLDKRVAKAFKKADK